MSENSYIFNFKYIKIIAFILLIIPAIRFIGNKYQAASTENLINTYNEKRFNEFYSLPKNSIDMVFVGSSHSYCTFDPEIFDSNMGTNSYQMGMPLQHPDSTYYTLQEILNYQSPKRVVMEVYWDMLDDDFELNQATMLFQVLRNDSLKNEYIKNVFPLSEKVKYYVNVFKYQNDYFAYRNNLIKKDLEAKFGVSEKSNEKQQGIEQYRSKGYTYCDYSMLQSEFDKTNQFNNFDGKNWSFNDKQKKYIQNIIKLCELKNIELIFVTAPVANVSIDKIKNYEYIHNTISDFANENNIKYLDFNIVNKEQKLLINDNFRDDAHLNHSGVQIVDNYFIKWLNENSNVK